MKTDLRHGKVCYWALIFSVAAHSAVLGVFSSVKLSGKSDVAAPQTPVINMQMIQRAVAESESKPKPRVEPIEKEPISQPESKQPPLISESQTPEPIADNTPQEPPQTSEKVIQAPPQLDEVEFFGHKSVISRVCYVVDCSGSMYGRMYQVKDQLKKSILNLNSHQSFSVVFFMEGQTIQTSNGQTLAPATAGAKSMALELIDSVRPSGSTDVEHALEVAMQLEDASGKGAQAIYFLTDGFDLNPASSRAFAEKIGHLRSTFAPEAVLHTIGFGAQPLDRQMLRLLAENTGGVFIDVK